MADTDPQATVERRECARHLLRRPFTCAEHDPEVFSLIRRHEAELDRWFTQRLGYRLHVDTDTARLFKSGVAPWVRPLRMHTERPFTAHEYTLLALVLAATAAGPAVVSLRDLVASVRSAAAETEIPLAGDAAERRAIVSVLRWMIDHGLAAELHEHVDRFASDEDADAILRMRPDRIALLPMPALIGAESAHELFERSERRSSTRQWMRGRLVEDPVLYRSDLDEVEWTELRRRLGDEERLLDEMFGLVVEARAEGVAAIDPAGSLTDLRFPTGGTIGHAALLLIERLRPGEGGAPDAWTEMSMIEAVCGELAGVHAHRWSNELVGAPHTLAARVIELLVDLRLAERSTDGAQVRLLAAAARFVPVERDPSAEPPEQGALW
jgi:uncharacterized protein (TIGR02678 family)